MVNVIYTKINKKCFGLLLIITYRNIYMNEECKEISITYRYHFKKHCNKPIILNFLKNLEIRFIFDENEDFL